MESGEVDPDIIREVKQRLAAADQRFTPGRAALLEIFAGVDRPLGIQEVIDAAPRRVPQSSVYRNVAVLCDVGVLRRLNFDEGFVRYELDQHITEHHHHLVCRDCGRVTDLDEDVLAGVEDALGAAEREIARTHGFVIADHQLELSGVCEMCS